MRYLSQSTSNLYKEMDDFFNSFFKESPDWDYNSPKVNVLENDDAYIIEAELPGYSEKDIEVQVKDNHLIIETIKEDNDDKKYLVQERSVKKYKRTFSLPKNCDKDKIEASMQNGVLRLTINKQEKKEAKLIKIKKL